MAFNPNSIVTIFRILENPEKYGDLLIRLVPSCILLILSFILLEHYQIISRKYIKLNLKTHEELIHQKFNEDRWEKMKPSLWALALVGAAILPSEDGYLFLIAILIISFIPLVIFFKILGREEISRKEELRTIFNSRCTNCHSLTNKNNTICARCGTDLLRARETQALADASNELQSFDSIEKKLSLENDVSDKNCIKCKASISNFAIFCQNCGATQQEGSAEIESPASNPVVNTNNSNPKRLKINRNIVWLIYFTILLSSIIDFIYFQYDNYHLYPLLILNCFALFIVYFFITRKTIYQGKRVWALIAAIGFALFEIFLLCSDIENLTNFSYYSLIYYFPMTLKVALIIALFFLNEPKSHKDHQ